MKTAALVLLMIIPSPRSFCQSPNNDSILQFTPTYSGELVERAYYKLSYIEEVEQPEWVYYRVDNSMLRKIFVRKDSFREDPDISTGTPTYADYTAFSEYDAGHLLPCRPMQFDCDAMSETFYMSNMSPQKSDFNRYKWAYLEKLVRNLVEKEGPLHIVSGPVLTEFIDTIGTSTQIPVPKYYYKVILKYDGGDSRGIAFVLENKKHEMPLDSFVVSIDSVESLTGIDFFKSLPNDIENEIEALSVSTDWGFSLRNSNFGYTEKPVKCSSNPVERLSSPPNTSSSVSGTAILKVNINTASESELTKLTGIGPAKAQAIIDARPFKQIEDIMKVKGIGQATFDSIKGRITSD